MADRRPSRLRQLRSALLRRALRAPSALYRHGWGWLLGHRFCELTHLGRRTGRQYHTVLEVLEYRPPEVLVLAGLGHRADWLRNIGLAAPVALRIGRETITPSHRVLSVDEAAAVLAGYGRRNRLVAPVLRFVLSRLAKMRYDGSTAARRELVERLPVVAFRPRWTGSGGRH